MLFLGRDLVGLVVPEAGRLFFHETCHSKLPRTVPLRRTSRGLSGGERSKGAPALVITGLGRKAQQRRAARLTRRRDCAKYPHFEERSASGKMRLLADTRAT
jgi:hypothetical protein